MLLIKKIKHIYTNTKRKIFSKDFWFRAVFLFVFGYITKLGILWFGNVDVTSNLLHPLSLSYWFGMAFFCEARTFIFNMKILSKKFWYRVISLFALGFIIKLGFQNFEVICLLLITVHYETIPYYLSRVITGVIGMVCEWESPLILLKPQMDDDGPWDRPLGTGDNSPGRPGRNSPSPSEAKNRRGVVIRLVGLILRRHLRSLLLPRKLMVNEVL